MSDQNLKTPAAGSNEAALSQKIIKTYALQAGATGLIPTNISLSNVIPLQVKMVQEIGKVYGKTLPKQWVQSTIESLIKGLHGNSLPTGKIPKDITLVGLLSTSITPKQSTAYTNAVGQIFSLHFASGGTMPGFVESSYSKKFKELVAAGVPK